jgi:4-hydroxy-tetrahydrodipicolinate reductase
VTARATSPIRTVLIGATGRMGHEVLRVFREYPALKLTGAVASTWNVALGEDAGIGAGLGAIGVPVSADLPALLGSAQLAIDFSTAEAASSHVAACAQARVPLLLGTTGLPAELEGTLASAALAIPLLAAPNTSLGIAVLVELVRQAATALPADYDIEIVETHHRHKRDAPSGTAIALGAAAASARGVEFTGPPGSAGASGPRSTGQVGFASVRGGDAVGEHTVLFLGQGERLSLQHAATDRAVFARGALRAGQWLAAQPPGRYRMSDVFSSKSDS